MRTRSSYRRSQCWLSKLPDDVFISILHYLEFGELVKSSSICKCVCELTRRCLSHLTTLPDAVPPTAVNFVLKYCTRLPVPPGITEGMSSLQMKMVLQRWPEWLNMTWNTNTATTITKFVHGLGASHRRAVKHLDINICSTDALYCGHIDLHYLDLKSLRIDGEGCDICRVLMTIGCREWDCHTVFLRGDIKSLGNLVTYLPGSLRKLTVINTSGRTGCHNGLDLVNGMTFIVNQGITSLHLCNVFTFCCTPARECSIVDTFISAMQAAMFAPLRAHWKIDRLQVDMIRELMINGISIECGIFSEEAEEVHELQQSHPDMIYITSEL